VTGGPEEVTVQARRNSTLKVIKGARSGLPNRPAQRRIVNRTVRTPIEEVLERLDEEPVEDPAETGGLTVVGDPAQVAELSDPDGDGRATATTADDRAGEGGTGVPTVRRRALTALLVALLAATLAGAGVYGHRWYTHQETHQARQGAVAAAKQASINFVSVSAASVDRDLQRISAGATGDFKEEFTRGQSQVRAAVVENRVESQGSVLRAGLVSGDRRRAVVLVAVDATVKNAKAPEGRPSHYRIQMDMVRDRDSGAWLVARLQFVG
jgi:Mce-associated membrane protein